MKIPFLDKIKSLEKEISDSKSEINWLLEDKNKNEIRFRIIEEVLKKGELGQLTKKRMVEAIRHAINS